jgi:hypothetical protein
MNIIVFFCVSVPLWQKFMIRRLVGSWTQNLLTFYFTKMYFYCIQNTTNEKINSGFYDAEFCSGCL